MRNTGDGGPKGSVAGEIRLIRRGAVAGLCASASRKMKKARCAVALSPEMKYSTLYRFDLENGARCWAFEAKPSGGSTGRAIEHSVTSDVDVTIPFFPRKHRPSMMSSGWLFKISQEAE